MLRSFEFRDPDMTEATVAHAHPGTRFVGRIFRILGLVYGLPALGGTLYFGSLVLAARRAPPPSSAPAAEPDNSLIGLVESGLRTFTAGAELLGSLADVIVVVLAVLSLAVLLASLAVYVTGRGLSADRLWARLAAWAMLLTGAGLAALSAIAFDGMPRLVALVTVAAAASLMSMLRRPRPN